jgi:hypothetical protein
MIRCTQCGHEWSGLAQAHCKSCCQHFNSVSAFDRHRVNYGCVAPASVGMVRNHKGAWTREADSRCHVASQTAA